MACFKCYDTEKDTLKQRFEYCFLNFVTWYPLKCDGEWKKHPFLKENVDDDVWLKSIPFRRSFWTRVRSQSYDEWPGNFWVHFRIFVVVVVETLTQVELNPASVIVDLCLLKYKEVGPGSKVIGHRLAWVPFCQVFDVHVCNVQSVCCHIIMTNKSCYISKYLCLLSLILVQFLWFMRQCRSMGYSLLLS